jgi:actin-related protein 5
MQKTAAVLREEKKKAVALAKVHLQNLKTSENIANHMLDLYVERKNLLERMESRKRDKEDFSKRGTAQAAKRMQIIAELGKEEQVQESSFGMDDNDWNVYKDIQKNCFSEDEEEDQQALNELEEKLVELDPEFNMMLYQAGSGGRRPAMEEDYQIRLWTDRYRGAELLFQPSIVGLECAGLTEALEITLGSIPNDQK